jgi:hypothetical protein
MKMRNLTLTITVIVLACSSNLHASRNSQPDGLTSGDPCRVMFVTSTTRDATSEDINDYNSFVQDVADASGTFGGIDLTWKAVTSTHPWHALDNTDTAGDAWRPKFSIYPVDGTKVSETRNGIWNWGNDVPIKVDEFGNVVANDTRVWTRTNWAGYVVSAGYYPPLHRLGAAEPQIGLAHGTGRDWIEHTTAHNSSSHSLYAISSTITAVPEPGSFCLLVLAGLGWAGFATKRK